MNLCLANVLDTETLRTIRTTLASAVFDDGGRTAGWHARGVKHNQQSVHDGVAKLVLDALERHPLFQSAVLPARFKPPIFSRYLPGMSYGTHIDDALMGGLDPIRSDLAVTVFLSDGADYGGGELVLETHSGTVPYRLEAGQAVVYPATCLHRVAPVTWGQRLAAVLWVQSYVRDAARREILFDLDTVRRELWEQAGQAPTPAFNLQAKTYANLLRAWAEN